MCFLFPNFSLAKISVFFKHQSLGSSLCFFNYPTLHTLFTHTCTSSHGSTVYNHHHTPRLGMPTHHWHQGPGCHHPNYTQLHYTPFTLALTGAHMWALHLYCYCLPLTFNLFTIYTYINLPSHLHHHGGQHQVHLHST